MTKYQVVAEDGVELNGDLYPKGTELEFDAVPAHVQSAIDGGAVAEVASSEPEESPKAEDAGSDSSSASEPVASEVPAEDQGGSAGDTTFSEPTPPTEG